MYSINVFLTFSLSMFGMTRLWAWQRMGRPTWKRKSALFIVGLQTLDRTRTYLMRYLEMVQQQAPTGADFHAFGWQPDGSFLCGEALLGSPTGNTSRRLKGAAARYAEIIKPTGDRAEWVRATSLLDTPAANNMAVAMMIVVVVLLLLPMMM